MDSSLTNKPCHPIECDSNICLTIISDNNPNKMAVDNSKIVTEIDKKKKSKKKKTSRCCVCNKKLGLMVFTCKCSDSKMFCITHLQPEAHQCSYDFKTEQLNSLAKKLTKVVNEKVVKV